MTKWFIITIAILYSLLRYGLVQQIPTTNWPAYIGNKAMAFCAVSFLVIGFWKKSRDLDQAKEFLQLSLTTAVAHAAMSAALLNPAYFSFLYGQENKLNAYGEMTLLFGALSLGLFLSSSRESNNFKRNITIFIIILVHVISVGFLKWINPSRWAYGLVPISLLSCLILITGIVFYVKQGDFQE